MSATGGDCSLSDEGDGTKLTCLVTLDPEGNAVVDATFTMVAEAPEGEGCPTVQNVATVKTDAFEPRPSNQTQVEVCAAVEAEPTPTPTPTPTPSPRQPGGGLPDTSTGSDRAPVTLLTLIVLAALLTSGASVARLRRRVE